MNVCNFSTFCDIYNVKWCTCIQTNCISTLIIKHKYIVYLCILRICTALAISYKMIRKYGHLLPLLLSVRLIDDMVAIRHTISYPDRVFCYIQRIILTLNCFCIHYNAIFIIFKLIVLSSVWFNKIIIFNVY